MIQKKIPSGVHPSWYPVFGYPYCDPELLKLQEALNNGPFCPAREDIFRVFRMPVHHIKVVILGQDPYYNGEATGLAFEPKSDKIPKSLEAIYEMARRDGYDKPNIHLWESQGVFLLNTALTVEKGKAGSHMMYWTDFISRVINYISNVNEDTIWALWGKRAKSYREYIRPQSGSVLPIYEAPHPAAEAYANGKAGFYTCGHFKKINELLARREHAKIMW